MICDFTACLGTCLIRYPWGGYVRTSYNNKAISAAHSILIVVLYTTATISVRQPSTQQWEFTHVENTENVGNEVTYHSQKHFHDANVDFMLCFLCGLYSNFCCRANCLYHSCCTVYDKSMLMLMSAPSSMSCTNIGYVCCVPLCITAPSMSVVAVSYSYVVQFSTMYMSVYVHCITVIT
jgi:hypothetical protein